MKPLVFFVVLCVPCSLVHAIAQPSSPNNQFVQVYPVAENDSRVPLYFSLAVSFGGDQTSSGAIPGVQLALDHINNEDRLLKGYILKYTLTDSQCSHNDAIDGLFMQLLRTPGQNRSTLGLIDSSCSVATEPTALISRYYNIPHVSCAPFSTKFTDKASFRNFFQLLPSEEDNAPIYFNIISKYKWRKIALIVQDEVQFISTMSRLKKFLESYDVTYSEKKFHSSNVLASRDDLFDPSARIFLLAMFSSQARQVICKAYQQGMWYPKYLFLTYGSYETNWWVPPLDEDVYHQCSPQERTKVLKHSLAVLNFQFSVKDSSTQITDTEIREFLFSLKQSAGDYFRDYNSLLEVPPFYFTVYEYAQHCHDAVWTLALALNKTIAARGRTKIEDFTYDNQPLSSRTLENVQNTGFTGITGNVSFDSDGVRTINKQRVLQYRHCTSDVDCLYNLSLVDVAISDDNEIVYLDGESDETVWPEDTPYDGVPNEVIATIEIPTTVIYDLLAVLGIVLSVGCLAFNYSYRNRRVFRLSSPNLNYLIIIGLILIYLSVLFYFIPSTDSRAYVAACTLQVWFTSIGYSLAIGTIVAKLFRVRYYYSDSDLKKKMKRKVKDWHLILFVLMLVLIDVVILTTYTVLEARLSNFELLLSPNRENPSETHGALNIITQYNIYLCTTKDNAFIRTVAVSIIFAVKVVLQLSALYLAFQTRRVKVKGFNDATLIGMIVYVTSILFVIYLLATILLREYLYTYPILFGSAHLIGATTVLCCIFVPEIVRVSKSDDTDKDSYSTSTNIPNRSSNRQFTVSAAPEFHSYDALRRRIQELENILQKQSEDESKQ